MKLNRRTAALVAGIPLVLTGLSVTAVPAQAAVDPATPVGQAVTWLADQAGRTTHEPFLFYAVVCVFYLLLTAVSGLVFGWLERRYSVGVRRAAT